jgi:hypothetical protein
MKANALCTGTLADGPFVMKEGQIALLTFCFSCLIA